MDLYLISSLSLYRICVSIYKSSHHVRCSLNNVSVHRHSNAVGFIAFSINWSFKWYQKMCHKIKISISMIEWQRHVNVVLFYWQTINRPAKNNFLYSIRFEMVDARTWTLKKETRVLLGVMSQSVWQTFEKWLHFCLLFTQIGTHFHKGIFKNVYQMSCTRACII